MKNYIQPGENITLAAPYDVASGAGVKVGAIFGVAAYAAASGIDVEVATEGVFTLPKATTDAFVIGDKVYWDNTAKTVTATATSNTLIGVALSVAGNPSASVIVRLNCCFS